MTLGEFRKVFHGPLIGNCGCLVLILRMKREDQMLQAELPGYKEYTERVRYRLFPGGVMMVAETLKLPRKSTASRSSCPIVRNFPGQSGSILRNTD
jgi:hypothetical protein